VHRLHGNAQKNDMNSQRDQLKLLTNLVTANDTLTSARVS